MSSKDGEIIEKEAGEDGEEETEELNGENRKQKRKKPKFQDSSDEDDEDDDGEDEFEKDGFIVDEDEEDDADEDGAGEDAGVDDGEIDSIRKKKKRHRRHRDYDDDSDELAEGDLELLEEHGHVPKRTRKRHRLKRATGDDDDDDDNFRSQLELLGDDEQGGEDEEDPDGREAVDEDVDDFDEFDDFIDDGGRSKRRRRQRKTGAVSSDAVRAARSVFGDYEEIADVYQTVSAKQFDRKASRSHEEDVDDAEEDDDSGDNEDDERDRNRRQSPKMHHRERPEDDDVEDEEDEADDSLSQLSDDYASPRPSRSRRRDDVRVARNQTIDDDLDGTSAAASRLSLGATSRLSAEDTIVVNTDIPERLQLSLGKRIDVSLEELGSESLWIYARSFSLNPAFTTTFTPENIVKKIEIVLNYMHKEKLDIPFIAQYRKDYIGPELLFPCGGDPSGAQYEHHGFSAYQDPAQSLSRPKGFNSVNYDGFIGSFGIDHQLGVPPGYDDGFGDWSALWTVFDWDKKWSELVSRRTSILELISRSREQGIPESLLEQARTWADACEDDVQLSDVERQIKVAAEAASAIRIRHALEDNDSEVLSKEDKVNGRRKRPNSHQNRYLLYCRRGYTELSLKFGINAAQLADNLDGALQYGESYQLHVPRDEDIEPLELAQLVGNNLADFAVAVSEQAVKAGRSIQDSLEVDTDPRSLLDAARFILTQEILAEPRVVQASRKILRLDTVMVSTNITQSGVLAVDDSHPLRAAVMIKDKPIKAFYNSTDFADIRKAESKGYTVVSFRFQPEHEQLLRRHLVAAVTVSMTTLSPLIEKWNTERYTLVDSVHGELTRRLLNEAEELLDKRTNETVLSRLTDAASRRLLQGPARPYSGEDGAPKVMAICVTNEEDEDPDPAQDARSAEATKTAPNSRPYQRPKGPRVTFVNLDPNGEFINSEEVFGFWLRRPAVVKTPPQEILKRIQSYLTKSKPQVVVIGLGSGGKDAIRLREDIIEVISDMVFRKAADFLVADEARTAAQEEEDKRFARVSRHVISIPEDVARLYCETNAVNIALPVDGMTLIEKRAIALGRMVQEPLSVYSGIAVEDDVASKLEFHRLHFTIDRLERVEAFRRALTRAVCTNGVDINRLLIVPHMQPLLQFVGGLGRCKATALIRKFEQATADDSGPIMSRKHLYANSYMGRVVFVSAAGFLRVRDPTLHHGGSTAEAIRERRRKLERRNRARSRDDDGEDGFFDPLDDSRIHPENYAVALKIADEALRDENGELRVNLSELNNISEASRIIAAVLDNPEGLSQLDLEKYADHLEKLDRGRLYETIKMVASEFQSPFKDYRVPARTPDDRAEFFLSIGADPAELRIGVEVTATNCHVTKKLSGISCRLPYGLRGYIAKSDFSDDILSGEEIQRLVSDGSDVQCRILGFHFKAFEAKLSSRPSVLADPRLIPDYELSYNPNNEYVLSIPQKRNALSSAPHDGSVLRVEPGRESSEDMKRKNRAAKKGIVRPKEVTTHDFYRDVSGAVATDLLRNAAPGEVVIRPSWKGSDQFVFTARFADAAELNNDPSRGIIHVMCYIQQPSEGEELKYIVGTEPYSGVDEILERFIIPVVTNMGEALHHRKFLALNEEKLEKHVSAVKKQAPNGIPYFFGLADHKSLYLDIYYIPGSKTVHKEPIKVVPDGYQFRGVLHTTLDLLTSWFKKNMRKGSASVSSRVSAGNASPYIAPAQDAGDTNSSNHAVAPASPFLAALNDRNRGSALNKPSIPPSPFIATPMADEAPPPIPLAPSVALQQVTRANRDPNEPFRGPDRALPDNPDASALTGMADRFATDPSMLPALSSGMSGQNISVARPLPTSPPPIPRGRRVEQAYSETDGHGLHSQQEFGQSNWGDGFSSRARAFDEDLGQAAENRLPRGDSRSSRGRPAYLPGRGPARDLPGSSLNEAAARRGQMPIPAWKKAQQETQQ